MIDVVWSNSLAVNEMGQVMDAAADEMRQSRVLIVCQVPSIIMSDTS